MSEGFPNTDPSFQSTVQRTIAQYGWMALGVQGIDAFPRLSFTTTIGLTARDLPEMIMIGRSDEDARNMFAWAITRIAQYGLPADRMEMVSRKRDFRFAYRVLDAEFVSKHHMAQAAQFYRKTVRGAQLVLPDAQGLYPWDAGCDWNHARLQSDIVNWNAEIRH